jgi:RND family efflux transporter MFP subunit
MKYFKWKYIVYLAVVLALFYIACKSTEKEPVPEEPVPVQVDPVERKELSVPIHTSGRLFPGVQSKFSFKTGGIVDKIYVDEGQSVKKGQLLAVLALAEVNAYMRKAENGYLKTKRDVERVQNLYNDRAATLEQLQNVKTAFEVAASDLEIARFNLKHSKIHAPSGGKILKRLVEVNEMIRAGYPVFVFGSTDNRWIVRVGVSLGDAVKLKKEDRAKVAFDAYPGKKFDAEVTEISEAVDPASGTVEVELEVRQQPDHFKLIAGFIAAVDIYPFEKKTYTLIPIDALVDAEGSEGFVFTVKDGKAWKVKISIAHLMNTHALVVEEDEPLRQVVTRGAPYLTDGSKVLVVSNE